jgi:hypothetical protein
MSKDAKFVKSSSRNDERDSKDQSELEKMKISNAEVSYMNAILFRGSYFILSISIIWRLRSCMLIQ